MAWKTIDSAPRDGTVIIGWMEGWHPTSMEYCDEGCGFNEDQPGWYAPHDDVWLTPTHWHKMPTPPKVARDTGD